MKPIIGILPSFDEEKKQIFLDQLYMDAVIESGGTPFVFPLSEDPKIIFEALEKIDFSTIPIYYNWSAAIHIVWYFLVSLIGTILGACMRWLLEWTHKLEEKFKDKKK